MLGKLFFKDGRLQPVLRIIVFSLAVLTLGYTLWVAIDALCGTSLSTSLDLADLARGQIAAAIAVGGVAVAMRRWLDRRSVASLGFAPRRPWLRLLAIGVALGAGMQACVAAIEVATGAATVSGLGAFGGDVRLVATSALLLLIAAFSEEMSTRGYVLQNLWEQWGPGPAVVFSSIGFALLHFDNPHSQEHAALTVSGLFAFALLACASLLWTGSLWLALGAHMAWNLFEGPVFGFPVSGVVTTVTPVVRVSVHGPTWLTGGAFGPEAGVISLLALGAGWMVLSLLHRHGAFADTPDVRESYAKRSTR